MFSRRSREKLEARRKELAEAKEREEQAKISADNKETMDFNKKIYWGAGIVAILGTAIILFKTRKK